MFKHDSRLLTSSAARLLIALPRKRPEQHSSRFFGLVFAGVHDQVLEHHP